MKKLLVLSIAALALSGCGVTEQLGRNCGGDLKELCYNTFGGRYNTNTDNVDSDLQTQIDELKRQVSMLNTQMAANSSQMGSLAALVASNNTLTQSQIASIQSTISSLQASSNTTTVQIATLQGYKNIVAIKDPCGAQGGWNEVFLQLADGHYLASFSANMSGDYTRLVQLIDGTYTTTDGTNCSFTVSGGGTVISNEHN